MKYRIVRTVNYKDFKNKWLYIVQKKKLFFWWKDVSESDTFEEAKAFINIKHTS